MLVSVRTKATEMVSLKQHAETVTFTLGDVSLTLTHVVQRSNMDKFGGSALAFLQVKRSHPDLRNIDAEVSHFL